jgi:hypothetical protein
MRARCRVRVLVASGNPLRVAPDRPRPPTFVPRRRIENGQNRTPPRDQGHRNRPAGRPAHEIARPVDRIDHPAQLARQPGRIIDGFLGKPARLGQEIAQRLMQEPVDGNVGLADRVVGPFSQIRGAWPWPGQRSSASCPADRRSG